MMMGDLALQAEGLYKRYGGRAVVQDVSLRVEPGAVVGLLGPNGAGKTTTFHLITGLAWPDAGFILLGPREITRYPFHKRARLGLNYLPQEPSVFRKLTVWENVWVVLEARPRSRARRREIAHEVLEKLGIRHLSQQRADTLSAGERRRVEIARALAASPRFLLLDEPFTGIDPVTIEELQEIILALKAEGLGVVITDHNVRETLRVTDYVYLIQNGRVFWEGPPERITENPLARKFYLGERFRL